MVFRLYPNPTAPRAAAVAESVRALLAARGQRVIGAGASCKADVLVPVGGTERCSAPLAPAGRSARRCGRSTPGMWRI